MFFVSDKHLPRSSPNARTQVGPVSSHKTMCATLAVSVYVPGSERTRFGIGQEGTRKLHPNYFLFMLVANQEKFFRNRHTLTPGQMGCWICDDPYHK